ncbi:hypothetical protein Javan425_0020 [Streptococcus phage Javan425]|uniref:Phage protein n=1 Tax=Streptococcus porcinus str. Jelinkova 176 TaxID=873448 RepID=A0ABN0CUB7_STRPO|nr:hypothetical protein [Streptococcus porcinus]EGJ26805.1 hypothetical protein STRPO_0286 [Streptococcus porcinus str. Jelinkova 176]QBX18386.1 hypothetical protein Javan423_0040 [Streptococcus phage Javan423]QBX18425.1 hypothetical protein Javan425_0020 [Streptococcus phage Javan425]SQG43990.1 Uncharacterised protein [Streptococcus porcinus]
MIYKDKETGAVVVTDCELSGDWEVMQEEKQKKTTKKAEAK